MKFLSIRAKADGTVRIADWSFFAYRSRPNFLIATKGYTPVSSFNAWYFYRTSLTRGLCESTQGLVIEHGAERTKPSIRIEVK